MKKNKPKYRIKKIEQFNEYPIFLIERRIFLIWCEVEDHSDLFEFSEKLKFKTEKKARDRINEQNSYKETIIK